MPAQKYFVGMKLGENETLLKERLPNGYGIFECSFCHKDFKTKIVYVASNRTKCCGCVTNELIKTSKQKDITNIRYGNLVALYRCDYKKNNKSVWHCRCDCGRELDVMQNNLVSGTTKSCGHKDCYFAYKRESGHKVKDISLTKIEKLTPLVYRRKKDFSDIEWLCKCECGNLVWKSSQVLRSGNIVSCGCVKSKGEVKIRSILQDLSIEFIEQKWFKDLINPQTNKHLYCDFYLPQLNIIIEYDGIQHFKSNNRGWHTDEIVKSTQERDTLKNEYCTKNNIKMIRISYKEYDLLNNEYLLSLLCV